MQIPNDLNDTERELVKCCFMLIGAIMMEKGAGFQQGHAVALAVTLAGPMLGKVIGNQPVDGPELMEFAL